jgi:CheY-like chemotaxis protein
VVSVPNAIRSEDLSGVEVSGKRTPQGVMVMKNRVLVVDDEDGIRLLYKKELEEEGCKVELAASGEEAIERLSNNSIDLVLLDIKMPGMDGFEVLRIVKERWYFARPTLITRANPVHGNRTRM